jgi:hypothetical protein
VAKPNYKFNKRQKELARQKKKEEKKERKDSKDEVSLPLSETPEDEPQKSESE